MTTLSEIAEAQKALAGRPVWRDVSKVRQETRIALVADGVGIEGLYVRIISPRTVESHGFLVQLEYEAVSGRVQSLARAEWKVPHTNPDAGPENLRLLECPSSHVHDFTCNYIQADDRMRKRNLPIAMPIEPDPETLEEFLAETEKLLRIKGLSEIVRPAFQAELLV